VSEEGQYAAWITVGLTGVAGVLLKLRRDYKADNRQITNDDNLSAWETSRSERIKELEDQNRSMWEMRIKDREKIAELEGKIMYCQLENADLKQRISVLENKP